MANSDRVRVRGLSIHRPIIYGNTAVVLNAKDRDPAIPPEHTHKWTVAVRSVANAPGGDIVGGADDLSYFIKRVTFKLHDTYANPARNVDKPPFEVSETGWGEFEIQIRITFVPESGEKAMTLYHHLKLHPWNATGEPEIPPLDVAMAMGPVHSWQYDEVVFSEPYQNFLNTLMQHPPTLMPKTNTRKKPIPFHLANPGSLEASRVGGGGVLPEFNGEMIDEELERLDNAKQAILKEHENWKRKQAEKEQELARLQQELAALEGA